MRDVEHRVGPTPPARTAPRAPRRWADARARAGAARAEGPDAGRGDARAHPATAIVNPPKQAGAALSGWPSIDAAWVNTLLGEGSSPSSASADATPATTAADDDPSPRASGMRLMPRRPNDGSATVAGDRARIVGVDQVGPVDRELARPLPRSTRRRARRRCRPSPRCTVRARARSSRSPGRGSPRSRAPGRYAHRRSLSRSGALQPELGRDRLGVGRHGRPDAPPPRSPTPGPSGRGRSGCRRRSPPPAARPRRAGAAVRRRSRRWRARRTVPRAPLDDRRRGSLGR